MQLMICVCLALSLFALWLILQNADYGKVRLSVPTEKPALLYKGDLSKAE
jgi:hypothetical protein